MNSFSLFINLIKANLKRFKSYAISSFVGVILLLVICTGAGLIMSKSLFKEQTFDKIKIAYYLPNDADLKYNTMALNMVSDMESISEAATLIRVDNADEGYRMLENREILYLIVVPENFFSGIMDSTNPRLTIVVRDYDTISSYIANELLLSYARYLGVAQAGIYSGLDTVRAHDYSEEKEKEVLDNTNIVYLARALNHEGFLVNEDAKDAGNFSLIETYLASAILLAVLFSGFTLTPWIQGKGNGMKHKLRICGVGAFADFLSNFISLIPVIYMLMLPCILIVSIYLKSFELKALVLIIPVVLIIALIISIICALCRTNFTANLTILLFTILIAYIGGGILPSAFLPSIVRTVSAYMPGEYMINQIATAVIGSTHAVGNLL